MKKWRSWLIFSLILIAGGIVAGQLFSHQILRHEEYKAFAQGQHKLYTPLKGERGEIFFETGEILGTNTKEVSVFVSPHKMENQEQTLERIGQIIDQDKEEIKKKVEKGTSYIEIKRCLSEEEARTLQGADLQGVYVNTFMSRRYPQKQLAAHIAGFLGGEKRGQYGIEGYYDAILEGRESFYENGASFSFQQDYSRGSDIYLTLDYNIQFMAEKLLKEARENLEIEEGTIIVMDPYSGEIMALANMPGFDPNDYSDYEEYGLFQNSAIQKLFEPGSIFKPITMASAIDASKLTPQTTYIDKGIIEIGGRTIYNYDQRTHGEKSMTEVLEKSINTGAVFAERSLGHKLFLEYIERFGFFEPTGIDLQGEGFSENREFRKGYEINFATASFGQGIEITPLQMIRAFSAIANGGELVWPHLASSFVEEGKRTKVEIKKPERVISSKAASQVTAMLVSVVENGFAKGAKLPGYYVAGKTGTAQIPWSSLGISKKGYSDKTWQSFVGFAPAFNPRFVALIKLDNPQSKTAEYSAVPIFHELSKYIINYLEIPTDYQPEE